jgi:sodium/bile acid cotransporter 7
VIAGIWRALPVSSLLILLAVCAVILAVALSVTRSAARLFGFARADEISVVFCSSHKSLVSGVPMARVLFAGPEVGFAVLPVMIYHQMQLMVSAWIARRYAAQEPR